MSATRIAMVVVLLGVVVGLIAYARGDEHHRGDEIGSWSDIAQVSAAAHPVGTDPAPA